MALDIEQQDQIAERGALIAEIMFLAYWVNSATGYCVFASFSGHVDTFEIEIAESKDAYHEKIASTEFYTRYAGEQPWKIIPIDALRAKRDHLNAILETGEIDPSGMDVIRHVVETYEF